MSSNLPELTFTPPKEAALQLAESWSWLLRNAPVPCLFSILGDVFLQSRSGTIWWLKTSHGELTRVAPSVARFCALLETDISNEWLAPALVKQLHAAGQRPEPGQCYCYLTLPAFGGGKYDISNFKCAPAQEHYAATGKLFGDLWRMVADESKDAASDGDLNPADINQWIANILRESNQSAIPTVPAILMPERPTANPNSALRGRKNCAPESKHRLTRT